MQNTVEVATDQSSLSHVLYSRGRILDEFNYFESLDKLSETTHRPKKEVEERILNGERKRLKSSSCLKKLISLESKFKEIGLDVYIEVQEAPTDSKV